MAKREAGNGRAGARKAPRTSSGSRSRKAAAKTGVPASGKKPARKVAPRPGAPLRTRSKTASASRVKAAKAPPGRAKPKTAPRTRSRRVAPVEGRAVTGVGLSDEEQILAAKYLPRDLPPRLFEEERFLFPESYHVNRVRLLVKDPDWIFAYWDVDPKSLEAIGNGVGERAMALARLSLRVADPHHGGSTDILLPAGARWWYVRTDSAARSYRAELGVMLPSGEFRRLAESNVVTTPRVGPSSASARRRVSYRKGAPLAAADAGSEDPAAQRAERGTAVGPWTAAPFDAALSPGPAGPPERPARGGASDTFRPGGASDVHRR
jgi:hypothetical protein